MRVLSLGAGVQSTTLLYMAHHGQIEPFDAVIFADTGWERAVTYENLKRLILEREWAGPERPPPAPEGPERNLPRVYDWLDRINTQAVL